MLSKLIKVFVCLIMIAALVSVVGCEKEGPMERAGKAVDEAIEDTGEAIEDTQEKVEDAMENKKDKKK